MIKLRNAFLIALILTVIPGCKHCNERKESIHYEKIHVLLNNTPVAGSQVFVNGRYVGKTNSGGSLRVDTLNPGDKITTRLKQYEHTSPRSPRRVMRVYITNVVVNDNGDMIPYYVPNSDTKDHYLNLQKDNTLIGFKIYVNAEWDMSETEMTGYEERFKEASKYLFNATDGQFFFEEVDIYDHNKKYSESEYTIFADHTLRAHSTTGGLLGFGFANILPVTIQLPRKINGDAHSNPPIFIHELGHFGFGLNDEYKTGTRSQVCTASLIGGGKNACLMSYSSTRPKFCSAHADNPHVGDLIFQDGDCWNAILTGYNDNFTNTKDKWELKSPNTRGVIVGQINNMPSEWTTKITKHNVKSEDIDPTWHLLKRFYMYFNRQDGTPAVRYPVNLWSEINPPGNTMGGIINIGRTNSNGRITIDGAHQGDLIMLPGNYFSIPPGVQNTE